jgi:hypothetical protein
MEHKRTVAKQLAGFTAAMQKIGTEFNHIGNLYYEGFVLRRAVRR